MHVHGGKKVKCRVELPVKVLVWQLYLRAELPVDGVGVTVTVLHDSYSYAQTCALMVLA